MKPLPETINHYRSSNSKGFTLIELLLALLVGSIVMLGVSGLLQSSAKAHNRVASARLLHEDTDFGSTMLKQQIGQIGYRGLINDLVGSRALPVPDQAFIFPEDAGNWVAGQILKADNTSLTFRYSGASTETDDADGSILSCTGESIDSMTVVETTIRLQDGSVICSSQGLNEIIMGGSNGVLIEQMLIEIGVDDDNNFSIDRMVPASTAVETDFLNARSIRLKLLAASEDRAIDHHQRYIFNGTEITSTDNRIRKEVVIAMAIRN